MAVLVCLANLFLGTVPWLGALLAAVPTAEEIRRKAEEVVSRPEYQLESELNPESLGLFIRLIQWLITPLRWLFDAMEGLPSFLRWIIIIVLTMILIALIVHIVWSFVSAIRGPGRKSISRQSRAREVSVKELEQAASESALRRDYIGAVRFLFSASLKRIEQMEERPFRRGITNRELLKRYRATPLYDPLCYFSETIESKWYGYQECVAADYMSCLEQADRIRALLLQRAAAGNSVVPQQKRESHAFGA